MAHPSMVLENHGNDIPVEKVWSAVKTVCNPSNNKILLWSNTYVVAVRECSYLDHQAQAKQC